MKVEITSDGTGQNTAIKEVGGDGKSIAWANSFEIFGHRLRGSVDVKIDGNLFCVASVVKFRLDARVIYDMSWPEDIDTNNLLRIGDKLYKIVPTGEVLPGKLPKAYIPTES